MPGALNIQCYSIQYKPCQQIFYKLFTLSVSFGICCFTHPSSTGTIACIVIDNVIAYRLSVYVDCFLSEYLKMLDALK